MGTKDPRIDAYIVKSADFAKPILTHLREVVHAACPEVEETMKWSSPHFDYKGEMMCGMAAFKEHCRFGFWKGSLIPGVPSLSDLAEAPMGRITSVKDLPSKTVLTGCVKQAMKLNDAANKAAKAFFEGFSPSAKREYVEWLTEAKTAETRARRLTTATGSIAEGKTRHWKYT